jgi:demethylmenaquinone methyltransferase/2-methoxy-6-polyprenyl-1,4-benzoquinol methylase
MSERINKIFTDVSKHYDFMNHLLSFGVDKNWRKEAVDLSVKLLDKIQSPKILDVATGTGDLAIELSKKLSNKKSFHKIIAIDFNKEMLLLGKKKSERLKIKNISFEVKDALKTKLPDESFDLSISGFALRNLDDLEVFAKEQKRILKKNGYFLYLDMAMPDGFSKRLFFQAYSIFMKIIGFFVDYKAYSWLSNSISKFDKKKLLRILKDTGFKDIHYLELKTGIAYIVYGKK